MNSNDIIYLIHRLERVYDFILEDKSCKALKSLKADITALRGELNRTSADELTREAQEQGLYDVDKN